MDNCLILKLLITFGVSVMLFIALINLTDEMQCSDLTPLHSVVFLTTGQ